MLAHQGSWWPIKISCSLTSLGEVGGRCTDNPLQQPQLRSCLYERWSWQLVRFGWFTILRRVREPSPETNKQFNQSKSSLAKSVLLIQTMKAWSCLDFASYPTVEVIIAKKKITAISITIPNSLTLAWAYMDFLPCLFSAASERRETPGILLENWLIGYLSSLQTSRDHTGKYPSVTVLGHQSSDFLFSVLDTGSSSSSSSGSPCAICW